LTSMLGLQSRQNDPILVVALVVFFRRAGRGGADALPAVTAAPPEGLAEDWSTVLEGLAGVLEEHGEQLQAWLNDLDTQSGPAAADEGAGGQTDTAPLQLGIACYKQGEYDRAIAHLTAAVRLNPKDALAYAYRADAN